MVNFPAKRPAEAVTLTFEFQPSLPAGVTVEAVLAVTAEVYRGADEDVAQRLTGAPALAGADVLQRFEGGVVGVDYLVVAQVRFSDQQVRELPALLPVRNYF